MNDKNGANKSRRQFTKTLTAAVIAVPVTTVLGTLPSQADANPPLDPASPTATALEYIAVSDKEGKSCATCTLYQGKDAEPTGTCPLFAGSSVAAGAWCSAWVPKA